MSDEELVEGAADEIWESIEEHPLSKSDTDPETTVAFYDAIMSKLQIARDAIASEHGIE